MAVMLACLLVVTNSAAAEPGVEDFKFDGSLGSAVEIAEHHSTATIRAVPEPSALILMAVALFGGLLLNKRFSSVKPT